MYETIPPGSLQLNNIWHHTNNDTNLRRPCCITMQASGTPWTLCTEWPNTVHFIKITGVVMLQLFSRSVGFNWFSTKKSVVYKPSNAERIFSVWVQVYIHLCACTGHHVRATSRHMLSFKREVVSLLDVTTVKNLNTHQWVMAIDLDSTLSVYGWCGT